MLITKIPGIRKSFLSGWPLVCLIAVGLTVVALVYGGATGKIASRCTMTVQATEVTVRSAPNPTAKVVGTLTRGTETAAEPIVESGYRKLTGGERWVPSASVAATSGSQC